MITTGYDTMRLLESTIEDVRIFSDRIFGYKRYYVDWGDKHITTYHGVWYNLKTVEETVQARLERNRRKVIPK